MFLNPHAGCATLITVVLFWSMTALAQTPPRSQPFAATDPAAQDTQFIALFSSRDTQLASIAELKRIISYHDNLRNRIEQRPEVSSFAEPISRSAAAARQLNDELRRLQSFENAVEKATSLSEKRKLVSDFDGDLFPVKIRTPGTDDLGFFLRRESAAAGEVFQNVSSENKEFLSNYRTLISSIAGFAPSISISSLDHLPNSFFQLANGATSNDSLTEDQIQTAIMKYRASLQAALAELPRAAQGEPAADLRNKLTTEFEKIRTRLATLNAAKIAELGIVEKSLTVTAKALYGTKVGADSFTYLLFVFAAVFIVVMVAPKFYPDIVAINVLKSEFLLQFSTVFVLVAAIIILAIGGLIKEDQLPVLLAGISGYVLGQLGVASSSPAPSNTAHAPVGQPSTGSPSAAQQPSPPIPSHPQ